MYSPNNLSNLNDDNDGKTLKAGYLSDDKYWFTVECKYGLFNIGIYRSSIYDKTNDYYKLTVLEMVKVLNREEELIRSIEDWLQTGLKIGPCEKQIRPVNKITLFSETKQVDKNHGKIELTFGDDVLSLLPSPDEIVHRGIRIETSYHSVTLILSSTTISNQCVDSIKPGRVLLIPDSFLTKWYLKIRDNMRNTDDLISTVNGDIKKIDIIKRQHEDNDRLESNTISDSNDTCISIVINNEIQLPLDILHGWIQEREIILKKPLTNHKIEIHNNDSVIATGHLLAISSGYGVFIDTI